jgi:uncharacterized protein
MMEMIEMKLESVALDPVREMWFILLKDAADSRTLSIYISSEQADDLSNVLEQHIPLRPRTHDLMVSLIESHNIKIVGISIHSLQDNTFFASIFTNHNGQIQEFDARPSDAIALAIRTKAPIGVTEELMTQASVLIN